MDPEFAKVVQANIDNAAALSKRLPSGVETQYAEWKRRPVEGPATGFPVGLEEDEFVQAILQCLACPADAAVNTGRGRKRQHAEKMETLHEYDCAICVHAMTRSNVSVLVPCFHRFCYHCIMQWLKFKPACPLCKVSAQTLAYSIRSVRDFKTRHFTTAAAVEHIAPKPVAAGLAGAAGVTDAAVAISAGLAAGGTAGLATNGGAVVEAPTPALAPAEPTITSTAKPPSISVFVEGTDIPRAVVFFNSSGELSCTVAETNRIRAHLGLRPLRDL